MGPGAHASSRFRAALVLAASIALSATAASADPQADRQRDLMFSPHPVGADPGALRPEKKPSQPAGGIVSPKSRQAARSKPAKERWLFDWQANPDPDSGAGTGALKSVTRARGATAGDGSLFGPSSFQFRTEKNFQTPEPFRRTDCYNEDECADYSGFPKFRSPKTTAKNVRKPYLGLSITTPIN